jgi:hypothetical protein
MLQKVLVRHRLVAAGTGKIQGKYMQVLVRYRATTCRYW